MSTPVEPDDIPVTCPVQRKTWEKSGWLLPVTVALLPTLLIVILSISSPPFLDAVNLKIYDFLLLSTGSPVSDNAPLVVDIDEKSLGKYGQWPWPRFLVADLLEKIRQDEPLAVGLDIMFSEPDRTSLTQVYKNLENHFHKKISGTPDIPEEYLDNDLRLAETLRQGNFAISLYSTDREAPLPQCILYPLNIAIQYTGKAAETSSLPLPQVKDVLCNLPILADAVSANGFINAPADSDGILRRVPLLLNYQGKFYPHLSLATFIAAYNPETILVKLSRFGIIGLVLDEQFIPLDNEGNLAVNFRARPAPSNRAFQYISAADLLTNNIPKNTFTKKIVFLGTSAAGLHDFHYVPGGKPSNIVPGLEIHANVVDNILNNTFLRPPLWDAGTEWSIIILIGMTVAFLFFRFSIKIALLTSIFCGTGLFYGSKTLFSSGIFLSPLYPALLLILNFSLIYPIKFYISERNARKKKEEIARMQEAILEIITAVTEARDQETGGHIRRTQGYLRIMAEELRKNKKYSGVLTPEEIEVLCKVAPLHDVGKIAVPDNILLKPGQLSAKEFEEIKKHTSYGKKIIESALERVGCNYFLEKALEIVYTHQEKWDGSGYPQGLSGRNIPLSGRLMAIADVYDALTSTRPYKVPVEHKKAVNIMAADSGTHFDPELIEVFLNIHERFYNISAPLRKQNETTIKK